MIRVKKPAGKKGRIWQVARRASGATLEDGTRQDLILWVERASNRVRSMKVIASDAKLGASLQESFTAALEQPMSGCTAGPPTEIQVDDAQLAAELAAVTGIIPVTLQRSLDSLDRLCEMLSEYLEEGPGFGYLQDTLISPSEIKDLANGMIQFLEARPFEKIHADDVLEVNGLSISHLFVSVLGMSGIEYGLGIYLTRESAAAYLSGITEQLARSLPALSLTLVTEEDCPQLLDLEIRQHQWPCHPMGFPLLMRVDGERMQPDSQEIQLAIDCLKVVCHFADTRTKGECSVRGTKVRVHRTRGL